MGESSSGVITVYHNPACSKCRMAVEILDAKGAAYEIVAYLDTPVDRATVKRLIELGSAPPADYVRSGDQAFADAGLSVASDASADEVADLLGENPRFLQRPIGVSADGTRVVIARPADRIEEVL